MLQPSCLHANFLQIPDNFALDAAATIPDNCATAFFTLFDQLSLPIPSSFPATSPPPNRDTAILVYGAGSTTGQYTLQLLHAAGYTNVVATASPKHHALLRALGATHVFDYATPTLAADIAAAIGGDGKIALAVDSISADGTIAKIAQVLRPGGVAAFLLPIKVGDTVAVGDAGMRASISEEQLNLFSKDTKIAYVRTLTYRQVRLPFRDSLPEGFLIIYFGLVPSYSERTPQEQSDAQNSSAVTRVWNHPAKPGSSA